MSDHPDPASIVGSLAYTMDKFDRFEASKEGKRSNASKWRAWFESRMKRTGET